MNDRPTWTDWLLSIFVVLTCTALFFYVDVLAYGRVAYMLKGILIFVALLGVLLI